MSKTPDKPPAEIFATDSGYFILPRSILNSAVWHDTPHVFRLFLYLLGTARHDPKPKKYPGVTVERGDLVTSLQRISEDCEYTRNGTVKCWHKTQVSRMLEHLADMGLIQVLCDTHGTHIRICNYDSYQTPTNYVCNADVTDCNADVTVCVLNKNEENEENGKKKHITGGGLFGLSAEEQPKKPGKRFTPPTVEQVRAYCQERQNNIDPEKFVDSYTSKGWMVGKTKMQDWKAAVRYWESNDRNATPTAPKAKIRV